MLKKMYYFFKLLRIVIMEALKLLLQGMHLTSLDEFKQKSIDANEAAKLLVENS